MSDGSIAYAWIENGVVVNIVALFPNDLPNMDDFPDVTLVPLPDGYGIGDFYEDGVFTKAPVVEPPPPEPTLEDRIIDLENEVLFLKGEVAALRGVN